MNRILWAAGVVAVVGWSMLGGGFIYRHRVEAYCKSNPSALWTLSNGEALACSAAPQTQSAPTASTAPAGDIFDQVAAEQAAQRRDTADLAKVKMDELHQDITELKASVRGGTGIPELTAKLM